MIDCSSRVFSGVSRKNSTPSLSSAASAIDGRFERGHAMLELTFVFPILIMIIVGTIEFTRAYNAKEVLSVLAREAAKDAFRTCYEEEQLSCEQGAPKVLGCISAFAEEPQEALRRVLGDDQASLTISMYRWVPPLIPGAEGRAELIARSRARSGNTIPPSYTGVEGPSEFDDARVTAEFGAALAIKGGIVVSEVQANYGNIFNNFGLGPTGSRLPSAPGTYYDVTVF